MRIQLNRTRDDQGAIAIVVAILSIVFVVLAAIAVDFGNAYAVKRQLSVAADAAALAAGAAANKQLPVGVSCTSRLGAMQTAAQATATSINAQNDLSGNGTVTSVNVFCADNGVRVTVTNSRTVKTVFGGVAGVSSLTPQGSATAIVQVPAGGAGLRPIAACATTVTSALPGKTPFPIYVDKTTAGCDTVSSGQWGWTNFLDQGVYGSNLTDVPALSPPNNCNGQGNNAPCADEWLKWGFGGQVTIPNNYVGGNTGLGGNTGFQSSTVQYMESLVGQVVSVPVASSFSSNGKRIDVVGIVSVLVCSVNEGGPGGNGPPTVYSTGTTCGSTGPAPTDPEYPTWNGLPNNSYGLWVVPVDYATSGVFGGSSCPVGDPQCDFGTRAVSLYK